MDKTGRDGLKSMSTDVKGRGGVMTSHPEAFLDLGLPNPNRINLRLRISPLLQANGQRNTYCL